jgi:hypothetical protein
LQQHYTASPASAHALTAYLQSVDVPRAKSQPAAGTSQSAGDERIGVAATSAGPGAGALDFIAVRQAS